MEQESDLFGPVIDGEIRDGDGKGGERTSGEY
jgi:hypothetical protein